MANQSIRIRFYSQNTCDSTPIIVCGTDILKQHHPVDLLRSREACAGPETMKKIDCVRELEGWLHKQGVEAHLETIRISLAERDE
jgi:hypothetical protein